MQQLDRDGDAQHVVGLGAERPAGRQAQRGPQRLARPCRVLAHRPVEPLDRFAVGHGVEHRTAHHLGDLAQLVLDVGDQVGLVGRAGHGSRGWIASSTGSQMSGWPSASSVPR